jgi:hypothetical protein
VTYPTKDVTKTRMQRRHQSHATPERSGFCNSRHDGDACHLPEREGNRNDSKSTEADTQLSYCNRDTRYSDIITEDGDIFALVRMANSGVLFKLAFDGSCVIMDEDTLRVRSAGQPALPGPLSISVCQTCVLAGCVYSAIDFLG